MAKIISGFFTTPSLSTNTYTPVSQLSKLTFISSGFGTVQLRNMITPKAIRQEQSITTSCPTTMCGGLTLMYGFATESVRAAKTLQKLYS